MSYRGTKIKFRGGHGANRMLMKKLLINFLSYGKIETTIAKTKSMKPLIEKVVEKAKEKNEANKNWLLRYVDDKKNLDFLFTKVGPALKDKKGGYVRIIKLHERINDGTLMARIEWVYPVVREIVKKVEIKKEVKK